MEEFQNFQGQEAFFKLFSSRSGSCLYFNNPSEQKTIIAKFNLNLRNLRVKDMKDGADTFRVVL